MSESPESSHYEIALTNRQVLTVFVILLVCVTLAFFSGVWVGRKGTGIPVESVAAETIQAGVAPGEAPLEELKFFTRDDPEEPAAAEATEPEPAASPEPEPRRRPQAPETVAEAAPAPIVESAEEEPARRPEVTEPRPNGLPP